VQIEQDNVVLTALKGGKVTQCAPLVEGITVSTEQLEIGKIAIIHYEQSRSLHDFLVTELWPVSATLKKQVSSSLRCPV
jgi:hypothetical protein